MITGPDKKRRIKNDNVHSRPNNWSVRRYVNFNINLDEGGLKTMNARCKWKEFNRWWKNTREDWSSIFGDAASLRQIIDDKLKELQRGDKT